jgi:hypothetical protein
MRATLRLALGIALTVWMSALAGCDALGNPPRFHRTPAAVTQLGPVRLVTRTETVPVARSGELRARIEGRPHRAEPLTTPFLTLVVVDVDPPGAAMTHRVSLMTEIASASGVERHRWSAPGAARPFVAVFATRAPPRTARTFPDH